METAIQNGPSSGENVFILESEYVKYFMSGVNLEYSIWEQNEELKLESENTYTCTDKLLFSLQFTQWI